MGPHFINVDLEVWSATDLVAFAAALESKSLVLYAGKVGRRFLVSIESKATRLTDPARTIRALLRVIESLPASARRDWDRATARVFNVGFEGGEVVKLQEKPKGSGRWYPSRGGDAAMHCETSLSAELLQAVARIKGTITTTVYAPTEFMRGPARERTRRQLRRGAPPNRALNPTGLRPAG
jgi:hypothetical protein